jgi:uncharacterized protein (UPF0333 family)
MINVYQKQSSNQGQAALATVFLIGGVIILFALTLAFLALRVTASTFSAEAGSRALAAATAAAEDGIIRIVRDPNFEGTVPFPASTSTVTSVDIRKVPFTNQTKITASSTVGTNSKIIEVIVDVSSSTGRVDVLSWEAVR